MAIVNASGPDPLQMFLRSMVATSNIFMEKERLKLQKEEQANRTKQFEQEVKEFEFGQIKEEAERAAAPGILDALIQQGNVPGLQQASQNVAAQSPLGQLNQQTGGGAEVGLNPAQAQAVLGQFGGALQLQQGAANIKATDIGIRRGEQALRQSEKMEDLTVRGQDLANQAQEAGIDFTQARTGLTEEQRRLLPAEFGQRIKEYNESVRQFNTGQTNGLLRNRATIAAQLKASGQPDALETANDYLFGSPTGPTKGQLIDGIGATMETALDPATDPLVRQAHLEPFTVEATVRRAGLDPSTATAARLITLAQDPNATPKSVLDTFFSDVDGRVGQPTASGQAITQEQVNATKAAAVLFVQETFNVSVDKATLGLARKEQWFPALINFRDAIAGVVDVAAFPSPSQPQGIGLGQTIFRSPQEQP